MSEHVFDDYAERYDGWFLKNEAVLMSEVRLVAHSLTCRRQPGDVLSAGCGSGLFEMLLGRDHGVVIETGIEPAEGMADIARRRGMQVEIAGAEKLPFDDKRFDTVLFNGTPSYIADLEASFAEARRVLKPGGQFIVCDVPKESSYALLYNLATAVGSWDDPRFAGVAPSHPYPIEFAASANWRTTAEKIELLQQAGFGDLRYAQTLTRHPTFSNESVEEPQPGYDRGDYVAINGVLGA
jgi:ubiquinone/menaquinone biosynthesis C-methylase UbiE